MVRIWSNHLVGTLGIGVLGKFTYILAKSQFYRVAYKLGIPKYLGQAAVIHSRCCDPYWYTIAVLVLCMCTDDGR